jgi:hypothetical protein
MTRDAVAVAQIDNVFSQYPRHWDENHPDSQVAEFNSIANSLIIRLCRNDSTHVSNSNALLSQYHLGNAYAAAQQVGILDALKFEFKNGYTKKMTELIHADVFSDFIDMADYLLSEGYKDAAAVISGSTLEAHLRKLCFNSNIPLLKPDSRPKKAESLNTELCSEKAYGMGEQKQITAWLHLRNSAAHGQYSEYNKDQVQNMNDGIRGFILRFPA